MYTVAGGPLLDEIKFWRRVSTCLGGVVPLVGVVSFRPSEWAPRLEVYVQRWAYRT